MIDCVGIVLVLNCDRWGVWMFGCRYVGMYVAKGKTTEKGIRGCRGKLRVRYGKDGKAK